MKIIFITSHPHKAKEISRHLGYPVTHQRLELPEIQSLDPHEVVRVKAKEAYHLLKQPVLVEDFSLRFEALGQLPGPLIKWFLQELRAEGLCRLLDSYPSRVAYAQTCFGYCDEQGVQIFDGILKGTISHELQGDDNFGTDNIFVPAGQFKTWGDMNEQEQITYSVRRVGLKKLETFLVTEDLNPYGRGEN